MTINFNKAEFVLSATTQNAFIRDGRPQVTFAGRSNVGKSSVINRLLNRKNFARVGATPGKTSQVNYFRIDGKLRKTPSPPKSVGASIVSRIKILANMDISITRVPQDGRFTMMVDRREINVRVSTLPTIYGENVVMRLLDMSTNHVYTLDKLGMSDKDCKTISQTIERPYGMILSTGPTGSGKSTSLYSILQLLNKPDVNAITLEDPVEYRIDGLCQGNLRSRKSGAES